MPTVYELALIVGAAVGGGTLASVATRYIHRPEVSTLALLLLAVSTLALLLLATPWPPSSRRWC